MQDDRSQVRRDADQDRRDVEFWLEALEARLDKTSGRVEWHGAALVIAAVAVGMLAMVASMDVCMLAKMLVMISAR